MERNIIDIAILLLTQAMINLGEVEDPVTKQRHINVEGAGIFIDLLSVLKAKTDGNLTEEEAAFIEDALDNLKVLYAKKINVEN